jgi:hypothetical protein
VGRRRRTSAHRPPSLLTDSDLADAFLGTQDAFLVSKQALACWVSRELRQSKSDDRSNDFNRIRKDREVDAGELTEPGEGTPDGSATDEAGAVEMDGDGDVIDSSDLLCPHGAVDPSRISSAKRISQVGRIVLWLFVWRVSEAVV